MTEAHSPSPLYVKLLAETAQIGWSELERFFARGVLLKVARDLDLVSVAECVANDDTKQISEWLAAGLIERVQAETAADYAARDPELCAVVLSPCVCMQERQAPAASPSRYSPLSRLPRSSRVDLIITSVSPASIGQCGSS